MKCRTCGTPLSAGALLCGECGTSAIAPRPTLGDTARYDRTALLQAISAESARVAADRSAHNRHSDPRRSDAHSHPPAVSVTPTTAPVPAEAPAPAETPAQAEATAETPAPPATSARPTFSLVFSTGESIRVAGTGLVGRNPAPAEGEHVDYLVQLIDPQRSVSKTHLAFGLEDGGLWVADRASSNGSRLRPGEPDTLELMPHRRTLVERGTRIGIGDEWFEVR